MALEIRARIDECDPDDLPAVLRRLLASTAAGLRISEGRLAAAEESRITLNHRMLASGGGASYGPVTVGRWKWYAENIRKLTDPLTWLLLGGCAEGWPGCWLGCC